MAISWDIKINNVNVPAKRADVTVTRTDTESALPPTSYSFTQTVIAGADAAETTAIRLAFIASIKALVEKAATKKVQVDTVITNLEQAAKSALEMWESTR